MSDAFDAIVAGAGFTGLAAASALRDAGLSFCLLEARDRVGGRVEAEVNALGELVDTGGQFFCDDMPAVFDLVRRLDKTVVAAPVAGRALLHPGDGTGVQAEAYSAEVEALRAAMEATEPDDPAIAGLSVEGWASAQPASETAKAGFKSLIQGLWCRPADKIPAWHLIECERRITNEVSELQYFLGETMHSLAADLADRLGDSLRLSSPVEAVRQMPDGVEIDAGGQKLRARKLILAVPPSRAARLTFEPPLPGDLASALDAWQPGWVIKVFLRYESAFWRDRGQSGIVMWHDPPGLYACDASHADAKPGIVMFVGGPLARQWISAPESLRDLAVAALVEVLGESAASPLDVTVRDWVDDAWSGGAYNDIILDMEARGAEDRLRAGHGDIVFASSELSPSFPGYVEGAITAGRIAAKAVSDSLKV